MPKQTQAPPGGASKSPFLHEVHLNLNVRGLKPTATLEINELSDRLIQEGRQVCKLGLGQSPFPIPAPVVEELRSNAHQRDYLPVRGLPALCEAVADYYDRTQQLGFRSQDILIGPGSKELMFILQLVYYGDLVIPTPSWVSYAPQAHIIGRHVHWLKTRPENGWLLTPDELERLCREDPTKPRIVVLNYPNNPTGATYHNDELKALAETARRYRIILLSDEIYGELDFAGTHTSIARFYPEGTIVSGGLSKWCAAGGWRLGTFAFPSTLDWLLRAMAVVASETYSSTSAPIQHAAVRAYRGGTRIEHYLIQCRRILKALGVHLHRQLGSCGLQLNRPQGAFYLFVDFSPLRQKLQDRQTVSGQQLCTRLLEETGIALLPGVAFGRSDESLTARLAYVDFDGARALAAAEQIPLDRPLDRQFLETYCGKVIAAGDRICRWLQ